MFETYVVDIRVALLLVRSNRKCAKEAPTKQFFTDGGVQTSAGPTCSSIGSTLSGVERLIGLASVPPDKIYRGPVIRPPGPQTPCRSLSPPAPISNFLLKLVPSKTLF